MIATKQNWFKRSLSLLLALVMCMGMFSVTAFAEGDTEFPTVRPTASMPVSLPDGTYSVPVYMYARYYEEASMGNGAIDHTAIITIENGVKTVHLSFHDMPFDNLMGHLEIFYYYDNANVLHKATVDSSEWIVNTDTMDRVKTIRECSFVLPTEKSDVICRVKVDAMGETEQDAILVFDYEKLVRTDSDVDTTKLVEAISTAEAICNNSAKYTEESYSALVQWLDLAKSALSSPDLTQEYADTFTLMLQNAIDGLVEIEPSGIDLSALEAKIKEAEAISNDDEVYTEESYATLQELIEIAKTALSAEDMTQEYADQIVILLQNTIDGLVKIDSTKVDTSALESKIKEAEAINNTDGTYTEDSYAALQEAIASAKNAVSDNDLTQEQTDQLVALLQSKIAALALVPKEVDTTSLEKLIAYAETISNEDGSYSAESYSKLQSEITEKKAICENYSGTESELSDYCYQLCQAILKLDSVYPGTFEEGYYETGISFYSAYYDHDLNLNMLKNGTSEYELMKNIFGTTVKFKVEDGIYTIYFKVQTGEDDSWYYSSLFSNLGSSKDTETATTYKKIPYFGREIEVIDVSEYVIARTMDQPHTYKSGKTISVYGYNKAENTQYAQNITQIDYDDGTLPYFEVAIIDIDWENAVKTGEIKVDKTELAKEMEFAEYIFTTDLSIYTDVSVDAYKEAYNAAKEVYESDSVKQSDVRTATEKLNKASFELVKNSAYLEAKILEASAIERGNTPEDKWNSLQEALSDAKTVLNDDNATQDQIKEQISKLEQAIKDFKSVDTSELVKAIAEAESIKNDDGKYTAESYEVMTQWLDLAKNALTAEDLTQDYANTFTTMLKNSILSLKVQNADYSAVYAALEKIPVNLNKYTEESVQKVNEAKNAVIYGKNITEQSEVDAMAKAIENAVDNLVEKTDSDKPKIDNGKYTLHATMLKVDKKEYSMSNDAINHTVQLDVVNGEYFITMQFKGLAIYNQFGYLMNLSYYDEGYSINKYGAPVGALIPAEVLSYQKDSDGNMVIDKYNDENHLYPQMIRIKLVDGIDAEYVPLQVFVPIMEAIATGTGTQNVYMKLDWSTLKATESDIEIEKPVEQSPAVDITDATTGVKVHADKGVFEEGVKLVVTEITKGADYDLAASALEEVGKKFKLYEIHFEDADGNKVQPNGTVTVSYPIPAGYDAANVMLYRINEDGSKTLIKGTVDGSYYTVITKSFSNYALVEKDSTITDEQNTQDVNNGTVSDNSNNNGSNVPGNPQTGDNRNIMLWLLLALASAGMLCVLTFTRKRIVNEGE